MVHHGTVVQSGDDKFCISTRDPHEQEETNAKKTIKQTGRHESSCSSCDNEVFCNYRQRETVTPVPEAAGPSPCCCLIHRPVDIKMARCSVEEASVSEHAAFSLKLATNHPGLSGLLSNYLNNQAENFWAEPFEQNCLVRLCLALEETVTSPPVTVRRTKARGCKKHIALQLWLNDILISCCLKYMEMLNTVFTG